MSSKTCPKCGGELVEGKRLVAYAGVTLAKKGDLFGERLSPSTVKIVDTSNSTEK